MIKYLEDLNIKDSEFFPEPKEINYYSFEMKTESYLKNGEKIEYKK